MAGNRKTRILAGITVLFGTALVAFSQAAVAAPELGGVGDADETHYPQPEHHNWTNLDYRGKDIHGNEAETSDAPDMSPPFILMLMNFAVVLFIVGWKVSPAVRKYVTDRHDSIKEALEEAERLRDKAKAMLDDAERRLTEAEAEIAKMTEDIRASAEEDKKRIVADAERLAETMKRDAEARIAAEMQRARLEIEREVVAAAIAAAERLIREQATGDDQTRLVDGFIDQMSLPGGPDGDASRAAVDSGQERV